ncbi:sensor histidine kinase [Novosphingobium sp. JCM 18896]|uniref:sensor histidine kinase n=1 Tax=Novosphingobium sp. JCM 18896 TaxID=2989731 RepID=UPI002223DA3D|nr:HWE histidine kinase domain-containing protein [Novosphingobium sp. JCM 18896]MCW1428901.1 DUF4118 domain-containing protein [Novosphingobium sp. JCM 18896]
MKTRSFAYITRSIRTAPSFGEGLVRSVLAVAIPTFIRWLIDGGTSGVPFVLYFPAIQMIATYLGWRWGAVTAFGSAIAAWGVFLPPQFGFSFDWAQVVALTLFGISAATMVWVGNILRNAVIEMEERARQSDDFNQELQHRTKNSLQMMRALASQSSKATDPAQFYEMLAGRLGALAKANELLRFGALKSCAIGDLVGAAIAPFNTLQFDLAGPHWDVSRNACTPLMMALHELATNASKYGSLSVAAGRVRIVWDAAEEPGLYRLRWEEVGGPAVQAPTHRGLGSRLLRSAGGIPTVDLRFAPAGVTCEMTVTAG